MSLGNKAKHVPPNCSIFLPRKTGIAKVFTLNLKKIILSWENFQGPRPNVAVGNGTGKRAQPERCIDLIWAVIYDLKNKQFVSKSYSKIRMLLLCIRTIPHK